MAIFRNGQTRSKAGVAATIVGGGIGFVLPASNPADAGPKVFPPRLDGRATRLGSLLPQHDGVLYLGAPDHGYGCTRPSISPKYSHYNQHPNVEVHINSRVIGGKGQAGDLAVWLRQRQHTEVDVFLPRFKMTAAFRLDAALQDLGMTDAFSANADFSAMDGRPDWLYIAAALHKAFVDVNEEGTEAAAATAVVVKARSLPFEFRADHPFIFLIHNNATHSILFLGRVVNPVAE